MGILDSVKNFMVTSETVEIPDTATAATTEQLRKPGPAVRVVWADNGQPFGEDAGEDPKVREVLDKDLQLAAKPAYSEFMTTVKAMEAVIPNEGQRAAAALAVLSGKGMAVKDVIFDIDECFQALDKKEAEFMKAAATQRETRVGDRKRGIEAINQQIVSLEAQITGLNAQRDKLVDEVAFEDREIQQTETRFSGTVAAVRRELTEKKTNIQSLTTNGVK